MLTIIDEFTRKCLAIEVARHLTSDDVLHRLAALFVERASLDFIRSDNGPEVHADITAKDTFADLVFASTT